MQLEEWIQRLLISSTFTQATIYVIRPFITYRAIEIGASAFEIGLIGALYALFPILLALKFGRLVSKFGESKFIVFGNVSMIVTSVFFLFVHNLYLLILATAMAGLSHLALMVGGQTMVALRAEASDYNKLFGYYTFSASLGHSFGPIIAGLLAGSLANGLPSQSNKAFIFAVLLSSLALIPTFKWRKNQPILEITSEQSSTWASAKNMLSRKEISLSIFISLAVATTIDLLVIFLPLLGKERMIAPSFIGLIISLRAIGSMGSRLLLGKVSKYIKDKTLIMSTISITALACVGMVYFQSPQVLALLVFIAGFMSGFGQPITMSLISKATDEKDRALAVSARLTGNRLGQFFLPILAGLLATGAGVGAVFWAMAGLLSLGLLAARSD